MRRGSNGIVATGAASAIFIGANLSPVSAGEPSRDTEASSVAQVIVVRTVNACFSAAIRVTGYLVPRQNAIVLLTQGDKVIEALATEGDKVTTDQTLARVSRQSPDPSKPGTTTTDTVALKASAAGVVLKSTAFVGATASPLQREPLFQIAVDNEIELEAEVPS